MGAEDDEGVGGWEEGEFTIEGDVSGMVKDDQDYNATLVGGRCELAGAVGVKPGAGSLVTLTSTEMFGSEVQEGGAYSVTVPTSEGEYLARLFTGGPEVWWCTCPTNCVYSGITAPEENLDFFVSSYRKAWWQTSEGSVHANLGAVSSLIPSTCVAPTCDPYLITGEPGLVSYSSALSLGDFGSENISESSSDWSAQTSYNMTQTGYDYFYRLLSEDPDGMTEWLGENVGPGYVVYSGSGVERTSSSDWAIDSGQQTVILHDGDLVIDENITVANGGFLAVIVSGNLTIADSVSDVQGIYVADGVFSSCEGDSDVQLNAEGTFVGWEGINLCRDFGSDFNDTNPAEVFTYRPDFLNSVYKYLEKPIYSWQEVAP